MSIWGLGGSFARVLALVLAIVTALPSLAGYSQNGVGQSASQTAEQIPSQDSEQTSALSSLVSPASATTTGAGLADTTTTTLPAQGTMLVWGGRIWDVIARTNSAGEPVSSGSFADPRSIIGWNLNHDSSAVDAYPLSSTYASGVANTLTLLAHTPVAGDQVIQNNNDYDSSPLKSKFDDEANATELSLSPIEAAYTSIVPRTLTGGSGNYTQGSGSISGTAIREGYAIMGRDGFASPYFALSNAWVAGWQGEGASGANYTASRIGINLDAYFDWAAYSEWRQDSHSATTLTSNIPGYKSVTTGNMPAYTGTFDPNTFKGSTAVTQKFWPLSLSEVSLLPVVPRESYLSVLSDANYPNGSPIFPFYWLRSPGEIGKTMAVVYDQWIVAAGFSSNSANGVGTLISMVGRTNGMVTTDNTLVNWGDEQKYMSLGLNAYHQARILQGVLEQSNDGYARPTTWLRITPESLTPSFTLPTSEKVEAERTSITGSDLRVAYAQRYMYKDAGIPSVLNPQLDTEGYISGGETINLHFDLVPTSEGLKVSAILLRGEGDDATPIHYWTLIDEVDFGEELPDPTTGYYENLTASITLPSDYNAETDVIEFLLEDSDALHFTRVTGDGYSDKLAVPHRIDFNLNFGSTGAAALVNMTSVPSIIGYDGQTFTFPSYAASYALGLDEKGNAAGVTFGGWYTTAACTGTPVTSAIISDDIGNRTYYAKWTVHTRTIKFDINGGTFYNPALGADRVVSGTYNSAGAFPTNDDVFYKVGFSLDGWYTEDGGYLLEAARIPSPTTGTITLKARWTRDFFVSGLQIAFGGRDWWLVPLGENLGEDIITLLAKDYVSPNDNTRFSVSTTSTYNTYAGSVLRTKLQSDADALMPGERALIATRELVGGGTDLGTVGYDKAKMKGSNVEAYFWPLSRDEADTLETLADAIQESYYNPNYDITSFWLRTPGASSKAQTVAIDQSRESGMQIGQQTTVPTNTNLFSRPAFYLDLSNVEIGEGENIALMLTYISNTNVAGEQLSAKPPLTEASESAIAVTVGPPAKTDVPDVSLKITAKGDGAVPLTIASVEVVSNTPNEDGVVFAYSGATPGKALAAVRVRANIVYDYWLLDSSIGPSGAGEASLVLPDIYNIYDRDKDKIYVFVEDRDGNGDGVVDEKDLRYTDMSSETLLLDAVPKLPRHEATPEAAVDYQNERLTNLATGEGVSYVITADGVFYDGITPSANGTIDFSRFGYATGETSMSVQISTKGRGIEAAEGYDLNYINSVPQQLTVAARAKQPNIVVASTENVAPGETTSGAIYITCEGAATYEWQYSEDGETFYDVVSYEALSQTKVKLLGFAGGTYYIRANYKLDNATGEGAGAAGYPVGFKSAQTATIYATEHTPVVRVNYETEDFDVFLPATGDYIIMASGDAKNITLVPATAEYVSIPLADYIPNAGHTPVSITRVARNSFYANSAPTTVQVKARAKQPALVIASTENIAPGETASGAIYITCEGATAYKWQYSEDGETFYDVVSYEALSQTKVKLLGFAQGTYYIRAKYKLDNATGEGAGAAGYPASLKSAQTATIYKIESKPTASVEYPNERLTGLAQGSQYRITAGLVANGPPSISVTFEAVQSYISLAQFDAAFGEDALFGKNIELVLLPRSSSYLASEPQQLTISARPPAPVVADIYNVGDDGDSFVTIANYESTYADYLPDIEWEFISSNTDGWQTADISGDSIINLYFGTEYAIRVKHKDGNANGTDGYPASKQSEPAFEIMAGREKPDAKVNYATENIEISNYEEDAIYIVRDSSGATAEYASATFSFKDYIPAGAEEATLTIWRQGMNVPEDPGTAFSLSALPVNAQNGGTQIAFGGYVWDAIGKNVGGTTTGAAYSDTPNILTLFMQGSVALSSETSITYSTSKHKTAIDLLATQMLQKEQPLILKRAGSELGTGLTNYTAFYWPVAGGGIDVPNTEGNNINDSIKNTSTFLSRTLTTMGFLYYWSYTEFYSYWASGNLSLISTGASSSTFKLRPAAYLDVSDVLFLAPISAKSDAASPLPATIASTGAQKITALDTSIVLSRAFALDETLAAGGTYAIDYSGTAGKTLTAILVRNGAPIYYWTLETNSDAEGQTTLTLPSTYNAETDEIQLLLEERNSGNYTDFASRPVVLVNGSDYLDSKEVEVTISKRPETPVVSLGAHVPFGQATGGSIIVPSGTHTWQIATSDPQNAGVVWVDATAVGTVTDAAITNLPAGTYWVREKYLQGLDSGEEGYPASQPSAPINIYGTENAPVVKVNYQNETFEISTPEPGDVYIIEAYGHETVETTLSAIPFATYIPDANYQLVNITRKGKSDVPSADSEKTLVRLNPRFVKPTIKTYSNIYDGEPAYIVIASFDSIYGQYNEGQLVWEWKNSTVSSWQPATVSGDAIINLEPGTGYTVRLKWVQGSDNGANGAPASLPTDTVVDILLGQPTPSAKVNYANEKIEINNYEEGAVYIVEDGNGATAEYASANISLKDYIPAGADEATLTIWRSAINSFEAHPSFALSALPVNDQDGGTQIAFGGYVWDAIGKNVSGTSVGAIPAATQNTLTLFMQGTVPYSGWPFIMSGTTAQYSTSRLRSGILALVESGAATDSEKDLIVPRAGAELGTGIPGADNYWAVDGGYLSESKDINANIRNTKSFFTRNIDSDTNEIYYYDNAALVPWTLMDIADTADAGEQYGIYIRPAAYIDASKILFMGAASAKPAAQSASPVAFATAGVQKITSVDESLVFNSAYTTADALEAGATYPIYYSGTAGKVLSAILVRDGAPVYYWTLATNSQAGGQVLLTMPADYDAETDQVQLFIEERGGALHSDFASQAIPLSFGVTHVDSLKVELTVSKRPGTPEISFGQNIPAEAEAGGVINVPSGTHIWQIATSDPQDAGTVWVDASVAGTITNGAITNLPAGTYWVREKYLQGLDSGEEGYPASRPSENSVRIYKTQLAPTIAIDYIDETLNGFVTGEPYLLNWSVAATGEIVTPASDSISLTKYISAATDTSIIFTKLGGGDYINSPTQTLQVKMRPVQPSYEVDDIQLDADGDEITPGAIYNISWGDDSPYEYEAEWATTDGTTTQVSEDAWQDLTGSQIAVHLDQEDVWHFFRAKATADYPHGVQTDPVSISSKQRMPQPAIEIDFANELLAGFESAGIYTIHINEAGNNTIIEVTNSATVAIQEAWLGKELIILRKADIAEYSDSLPRIVNIPARPGALSLNSLRYIHKPSTTNPATVSGEMQILHAGYQVEYQVSGSATWTALPFSVAQNYVSIVSQVSGEYILRAKSSASNFAGVISQPILLDYMTKEATPVLVLDYISEAIQGFVSTSKYTIYNPDDALDAQIYDGAGGDFVLVEEYFEQTSKLAIFTRAREEVDDTLGYPRYMYQESDSVQFTINPRLAAPTISHRQDVSMGKENPEDADGALNLSYSNWSNYNWEYSRNEEAWQPLVNGTDIVSGIIQNLQAGTYRVRVAATNTAPGRPASLPSNEVTIYNTERKPAFTINYASGENGLLVKAAASEAEHYIITDKDTGALLSDILLSQTQTTIPLSEAFFGKTLLITKENRDAQWVSSEAQELVVKPRPAAPVLELVRNADVYTGELGVLNFTSPALGQLGSYDWEYSLDGGETWANLVRAGATTQVIGLSAGEYIIRAKAKGTSASSSSHPAGISTASIRIYNMERTPEFHIDYTNERLYRGSTDEAGTYVVKTSDDGTLIDEITFLGTDQYKSLAAYIGQDIKIVRLTDDEESRTESLPQTLHVAARPAAPSISLATNVNVSENIRGALNISHEASITAYTWEYSVNEAATWQTASRTLALLYNLDAGKYIVRAKAEEGAAGHPAGVQSTPEVTIRSVEKTPEFHIDYTNERLYRGSTDEAGTYAVKTSDDGTLIDEITFLGTDQYKSLAAYIGQDIKIVRLTDDEENRTESLPQTLHVAARPAAPSISLATNVNVSENIRGALNISHEAQDSYVWEYTTDDATKVANGTANWHTATYESGKLVELLAGEYFVRTKAQNETSGYPHGVASASFVKIYNTERKPEFSISFADYRLLKGATDEAGLYHVSLSDGTEFSLSFAVGETYKDLPEEYFGETILLTKVARNADWVSSEAQTLSFGAIPAAPIIESYEPALEGGVGSITISHAAASSVVWEWATSDAAAAVWHSVPGDGITSDTLSSTTLEFTGFAAGTYYIRIKADELNGRFTGLVSESVQILNKELKPDFYVNYLENKIYKGDNDKAGTYYVTSGDSVVLDPLGFAVGEDSKALPTEYLDKNIKITKTPRGIDWITSEAQELSVGYKPFAPTIEDYEYALDGSVGSITISHTAGSGVVWEWATSDAAAAVWHSVPGDGITSEALDSNTMKFRGFAAGTYYIRVQANTDLGTFAGAISESVTILNKELTPTFRINFMENRISKGENDKAGTYYVTSGDSVVLDSLVFAASEESKVLPNTYFDKTIKITKVARGIGWVSSEAQELKVISQAAAPDIVDYEDALDGGVGSITISHADVSSVVWEWAMSDAAAAVWHSVPGDGITSEALDSNTMKFRGFAAGTYYIRVKADEEAGTFTGEVSEPVSIRDKELTPGFSVDYLEGRLYKGNNDKAGTYRLVTAAGEAYSLEFSDGQDSVVLLEAYLGRSFAITKSQRNANWVTSEAQSLPIAARPAQNSVVVAATQDYIVEGSEISKGSITVLYDNTSYAAEWAKSTEADVWQDVPSNNVIANLDAGVYYIRIKVSSTHPSSNFITQEIRTMYKELVSEDSIAINYESELWTGFEAGHLYRIVADGEEIDVTADANGAIPILEEYIGAELQIYKVARNSGYLDSDISTLPYVAERLAAPTLIKLADATLRGKGSIQATWEGASPLPIEWATDENAAPENWFTDGVDGAIISELEEGMYYVRAKAQSGAQGRLTGLVSVGERIRYVLPAATPDGVWLDYVGKKLAGLVDGAAYTLTATPGGVFTIEADEFGEYALTEAQIEAWFTEGAVLSIVRNPPDEAYEPSSPKEIDVNARPNAPSITLVANASAGNANNGKLRISYGNLTIASIDAFEWEYSADGGETWHSAVVSGGVISGLAPGSYLVRAGAKNGDEDGHPTGNATAVGVVVARTEDTPVLSFVYTSEPARIVGFVSGEVYIVSIDGEQFEVIASDESFAIGDYISGAAHSVVISRKAREAEGEYYANSLPWEGLIKSVPAAPEVVGHYDSYGGEPSGWISLSFVGTAFEWTHNPDATTPEWTRVEGASLEGLVPGTYYIRVAATDGLNGNPVGTEYTTQVIVRLEYQSPSYEDEPAGWRQLGGNTRWWYYHEAAGAEWYTGWHYLTGPAGQAAAWRYFADDGMQTPKGAAGSCWYDVTRNGETHRYYFWSYNPGVNAKNTLQLNNLTAPNGEPGHTYYFNSSGHMQTGWQYVNDKWRYFLEEDVAAEQRGDARLVGSAPTGWLDIAASDGKVYTYYFWSNGSGTYATGLQTGLTGKDGTPNQAYYFDSSGHMKTGWVYVNGKWRYFDDVTGAAPFGWTQIERNNTVDTYYFWWGNSDGTYAKGLTSGLTAPNGLVNQTYYFASDGKMQTGWHYVNGAWRYFRTLEVAEAEGDAALVGTMRTGGWWHLNSEYNYYFAADGAAATGFVQIEGYYYLFSDQGRQLFGLQTLANGERWYFNQGAGGQGVKI